MARPVLTLTTATKSAAVLLAEAVLYDKVPATPEQRQQACNLLIDSNGWQLEEYIAWINRPEPGYIKFPLMGADKWVERGITTASQLGEYLDAECEREVRKSQY